MGKGKKGILVVDKMNLFTELKTNYIEFENVFNKWLAKKSLPVEVAVITATGAITGAAISLLVSTISVPSVRLITSFNMGSFSHFVCATIYDPVPPITSLNLSLQKFKPHSHIGKCLVDARNLAVFAGARAGISCVVKRLRGKEDVQTSMVAGFGAGVMFSLVVGNQPARVIGCGVLFALANGGLFKAAKKFYKAQAEHILYNETRSMLTRLGLDHYEHNFKRGLLKDTILPSLTDSDLQEVKIPPGARKLILDHIKREKKANQEGWRWP